MIQVEDLFGETKKEVIRTLGFYQPFGTLMNYGKIETRWVRKGKKPPFPLCKYVFYTTKKECSDFTLYEEWCGVEIMGNINETLKDDNTRHFTKMILSHGELIEVRPLTKEDEPKAFVKFIGEKVFKDKNGKDVIKVQWALIFKDVQQITPVPYHHGKQGVGFLDKQYLPFIKTQP